MTIESKSLFESERKFYVHDFLSSHGQLLLRSTGSEDDSFNTDIIFFGTTYVQLFMTLDSISIRKIDHQNKINYPSVQKYLSYKDNYLFEIVSKNDHYFIAASFVRFRNQLAFNETSLGIDTKGREIEIPIR